MFKILYCCLVSLPFFLCSPLSLNAQKSIIGGYCPEINYIAEYSEYYKFYEDSSFIYVLIDDTGDHYGKGSFSLEKDSLVLNFTALPTTVTQPQLIIDTLLGEQTQIQVFNTLDRSMNYQLSYVIYENDSIFKRGVGSTPNTLSFQLQSNQKATVTGFLNDDKNVFTAFFQFEIQGKKCAQNVVYTAPGINLYKGSYTSHRKAIRINIKKNHFLLKNYYGWQKYKKC